MRAMLLALAMLTLPLAGCADTAELGGAASDSQAPGTQMDGQGAVRGTITDDSSLPLSDVTVALLGAADTMETLTDAAGSFLFTSVPPGEYRLAAQKLGYEAVVRKIMVTEGEEVEANLQLIPIQVVVTHHQTRVLTGFMACVVTVLVPLAPGYTSYACGDTAMNNNLNPNNKIMLNWTIPPKTMMHIAEMDWKPQSSMASQLRFQIAASLVCSGPTCSVGANYQTSGGPPPIVHRFDDGGIKAFGKSPQPVTGRFTGGPVEPTMPVRVITDQKFDVYITDWFGEAAPEGWTATPPPS